MPTLHLTDVSVRALRNSDKYITYWDDTTPAFGIRVGKRAKTWTVMRGRERQRVTIGKYPELSLAAARTEAKKLLASASAPKTERRTLLLSPVLENVLNRPTNLSFKGTIVARLDPAELGEFDCFVLGNLLATQYKGTVVVPDLGFYGCLLHRSLIRQKRLIAGVNSFDEVPSLRNLLMLMDTKIGSQTTPKDAELLALFAGLLPNTVRYGDFIQMCIQPAA